MLNFWKVNENRWPVLAKIAKKVLGVPAFPLLQRECSAGQDIYLAQKEDV